VCCVESPTAPLNVTVYVLFKLYTSVSAAVGNWAGFQFAAADAAPPAALFQLMIVPRAVETPTAKPATVVNAAARRMDMFVRMVKLPAGGGKRPRRESCERVGPRGPRSLVFF
jgi:hypothetical protein